MLLIMGLVLAMVGTTTSAYINQKRRTETQEKMKVIDTAIVSFVALQKRLPCPADGTINAANGVANAGAENCTVAFMTTGLQQNGVVPWTSLGLTLADGTDSWGNVFTYRVDTTSYTPNSNTMDFTNCTGAGSLVVAPGTQNFCSSVACTSATFPTACLSNLSAIKYRGLRVKNVSGTTIVADPCTATGAAYVLISHGENQQGAYSQTGNLIAAGSVVSGTQEALNAATAAFTPVNPANCANTGSYLVDDVPDYGSTTAHFDDFVSRPTLLAVAGKATLGPRSY